MNRWPWITLLLGAALLVLPPGQEIVHGAFFSGEQLSRNISRPLLLMALAFWAFGVAMEWVVRRFVARRGRREPPGKL